ncbi:hypothetical protein M0802_000353 [Mischocyttarus mexicanus]|nr:hypothetical protein M0802_000353 [Mischocyttarus mexicanus]
MESKMKVNIFDEFLQNIGRTSLTCSLFFHHGDYLLGFNAIINFCICSVIHIKNWIVLQDRNEHSVIRLSYKRSSFNEISEIFVFLELLTTGYVMLLNNNNYGLLANLFYATTVLFPSEKFYQEWTINHAINNYMTIVYVVLMTEALKQL